MSKLSRVTVYELGTGYPITKEGKPLLSWPYIVYYAPGHKTGDFYVGDGDARNGGGTFINARDLLAIEWKGHLNIAGASWLVPILERIAGGETTEPSMVFAAYKQVHGKTPPIEEWNIWM